MKTLIVKNNWIPQDIASHGWGNGYVLIPKDHKCYNIDYDTLNMFIEIHGGITYARHVHEDDYKYFTGLTKEDIGKRMVGFDTGHYMDTLEKWPKERVQEEADKLLKQLQEYDKRNKKRSIPIVVALLIIILLSVVSCTNKQEHILQYLDDNQDMVTLIYDSVDSINTQTRYLDSIGVAYWVSH